MNVLIYSTTHNKLMEYNLDDLKEYHKYQEQRNERSN